MKYVRDFPTGKHKLTARFQTSAAKVDKNSFYWVITQRVAEIPYRRFGTTNRSHLFSEPKTAVTDYPYSLRNNPEESSSQNGQLHREW